MGHEQISHLPENKVEFLIISRERDILTSRSPGKYDKLAMVLRLVPTLESAYYVGRIVDDKADGHRVLPQGFDAFEDWINHLKRHMEENFLNVSKGFTTEFLFKRAIERLEPLQRRGDDVRSEFNDFFDAMVVENKRRINGEVKTEQELDDLSWVSFSHVQNIAFIAVKSSARATNESGLSILPELLRRGYSVRDIKEDLVDNVCNIPIEVLGLSGLSFQELQANPELIDSNEVLQFWMKGEIARCKELIQILDQEKLDMTGKLLVKALTIGLARDISKLD